MMNSSQLTPRVSPLGRLIHRLREERGWSIAGYARRYLGIEVDSPMAMLEHQTLTCKWIERLESGDHDVSIPTDDGREGTRQLIALAQPFLSTRTADEQATILHSFAASLSRPAPPEEHRFAIHVTRQPYSGHGRFDVYCAAIEGGESQTLFRRTMFDAARRAVEGALRPILPPEPWSGTIEFSVRLHPDLEDKKLMTVQQVGPKSWMRKWGRYGHYNLDFLRPDEATLTCASLDPHKPGDIRMITIPVGDLVALLSAAGWEIKLPEATLQSGENRHGI